MAKRDPLIRRARRNPAVLRRALRNPEKRARLPENMIPRKFRPIVPGSAVTNKQLNRESKAAARIKYGPVTQAQRQQVGEAKAYQRDIGNYYDDYVKQVQAQSANVQQIGREAQAAVQGTQAGVTGLAASDLTQMNQAATKDAAARGATPGDLAQMASGAAATRQALVGSFSAQQAATNAANSTYAGNRANVVAPGQKLGAVAQAHGRVRQAKENLAETRREKGAFRFTYGQERKADEAKNVLAQKALGLDVLKTTAGIAADKRQDKLDTKKARQDWKADKLSTPQAREGAKYGYGAKAWQRLGNAGRAQVIKDAKAAGGSKASDNVYSSGPYAGRTKSEIAAMSPQRRMQLVDRYKTDRGGPGSSGGGRDYLTPGQSASGITQLTELKSLTQKAKNGQLFRPGTGNPAPKGRYGAEKKVKEYAGGKLKHPALVRAAADAVYDGHISAYTAKQLRRPATSRATSPPRSASRRTSST